MKRTRVSFWMPKSQGAFCRLENQQYNTKGSVWLTRYLTGTSRHCRQCWCYSCAQEHLYRHLSRAVGFACNDRSSTKVLHALWVPCCPPKRAKNLKCLWPSLGSTPHTACVTGSLQSSEMPALRIKQQRRWEHSCCRTRSHPSPLGPLRMDPHAVTGQWQPSGWQG